ncbi:CheY-like superfamily protein [Tribonema minus]|uniref:histidine kinase n=1 Tax=Tribonema minus TaxID=303371 RepID=A0A835ZIJ3_9STRA|nr:CheY-like superfamily protein [Tribonema minus]
MEAVKGDITFSSSSAGSTFTFTFPVSGITAYVGTPPSTPIDSLSDASSAAVPSPASAGRQRVLVVDDNSVIRKVYSFMLRDDYTCDVACDGLEALEMCSTNTYGLILMDVVMPKMNGTDCAAQIRRHDLVTPIVFFTGETGMHIQRIVDAGVNMYLLRKPVKKEEMMQLFSAILVGGENLSR